MNPVYRVYFRHYHMVTFDWSAGRDPYVNQIGQALFLKIQHFLILMPLYSLQKSLIEWVVSSYSYSEIEAHRNINNKILLQIKLWPCEVIGSRSTKVSFATLPLSLSLFLAYLEFQVLFIANLAPFFQPFPVKRCKLTTLTCESYINIIFLH